MRDAFRASKSKTELFYVLDHVDFHISALNHLRIHRQSWLIDWMTTTSIERFCAVYTQMLTDYADPFRSNEISFDVIKRLMTTWLVLRVSDSHVEIKYVWARYPNLRPEIVKRASDHSFIQELIGGRHFSAELLLNPNLTLEEAAEISFTLSSGTYWGGAAEVRQHLSSKMSYRFLREADCLVEFFDLLEPLDPDTFDSLEKGWVGSLEDLVEAVREFS